MENTVQSQEQKPQIDDGGPVGLYPVVRSQGKHAFDVLGELAEQEQILRASMAKKAPDVGNEKALFPFSLPDEGRFHNPIHQVYFRAGLLACREFMARFVTHDSLTIAASIRYNWWPSLGEDLGAPRKIKWEEIMDGEYGQPGFRVKDSSEISPTLEALPVALAFLDSLGIYENGMKTVDAPSAFQSLIEALQADDSYAWSWHCNLAMPIMDSIHCTPSQANKAAADLMQHLFEIDVRKFKEWQHDDTVNTESEKGEPDAWQSRANPDFLTTDRNQVSRWIASGYGVRALYANGQQDGLTGDQLYAITQLYNAVKDSGIEYHENSNLASAMRTVVEWFRT